MCHKILSITFRALQYTDLSLLHNWFLHPHVAYWWPEPTLWDDFYTKWSKRITTRLSAFHTPWFGHVIHIDAVPIGYIQHFFIASQQTYGYPISVQQTIGLDFFIGEPIYLGKKLSTPIIEQYLCEVIQRSLPIVTTVLIEPAITNNRAIHVYTKAGFKPLSKYTTSHDTILLMYRILTH